MTDASKILSRLDEIEAKLERANGRWPEWMSIQTAARYCDCSAKRIRVAIKNGRLIPARPDDGKPRKSLPPDPRLRKSELDAWHEIGRPTRPIRCDTMGDDLRAILESSRTRRQSHGG